MKKGVVYILRSSKNNKFYIGSTTDIKTRLQQYRSGNSKATRPFLPIKLEFFQEFDTIHLARKIERRLKNLKRKDYIEKIVKDRHIRLGSDVRYHSVGISTEHEV